MDLGGTIVWSETGPSAATCVLLGAAACATGGSFALGATDAAWGAAAG